MRRYKIVNFRVDRSSGWLLSPAASQVQQRLAVLVNSGHAATLTCDVFGAELIPDEFPARNVGFMVPLPPNLWTGESYEMSLHGPASGAKFVEGVLATQDPRPSAEAEASWDGQITECGGVAGWVARAGARATVQVLVDDQENCKKRSNQKKLRLSGKDLIAERECTPQDYLRRLERVGAAAYL